MQRRRVRGEAHHRRAHRQVDALDLAKTAECETDRRLVNPGLEVKEAERAVKDLRPRRDLLQLQHGGADSGGINVTHDLESARECSVLSLRALASGRMLRDAQRRARAERRVR